MAATPESLATSEPCHAMAINKISLSVFFFRGGGGGGGGGGYSTQAPANAELGPGLKRLIASVMDLPLMSARAASIPVTSALSSPAILEVLPLSAALPVMAVAILSVWAAHCTPKASSVHVSPPVPPEVAASAAETPEEAVPTTEPPEVEASAAEPPEVEASAAEPPEVVAPTHELIVCPVTATEAVPELTVCPVMATEAIHELTVCPVTAT